jgi:hypothetical protein
MRYQKQTVTAFDKEGNKVEVFETLTEAAEWISKKLGTKIATAKANICNTSLGKESRKRKNNSRKTAYGYSWVRG